MKKIFLTSVLFTAASLFFAGCLKDKGFEDHEYGINDPDDSPVAVGFPWAYSADVRILSVEVSTNPQNVEAPTVLLTADQPADRDIHVTLVPNQTLVADYNADPNNTPLATFPGGGYSIPNLKVTIPKGSRYAPLNITIPTTAGLDFSSIYGLGFSIGSIDEAGIQIASNLKNIVIGINVANQYAGEYRVTGFFFHPTASRAIEDTKTLGTISAVGVRAPHSDLYTSNYYFDFDISGTNTLVNYVSRGAAPPAPSAGFMTMDVPNPNGITFAGVTPPGSGSAFNHAAYNNTYDPATKTFWIHYGYGVGSTGQSGYTRQVYEKWVKK